MVRARGVGMVMSLAVLAVLTILGARACQQPSSGSPADPKVLAHVGIDGLCANQGAVDQADGNVPDVSADTPATLLSPEQQASLQRDNPAGLAALTNGAGTVTCPPPAGSSTTAP